MIPEMPVAYWLSDAFIKPYKEKVAMLGEVAAPCAGLATGNNNMFQRTWPEVEYKAIGFNVTSVEETSKLKYKWYPCNS